MVKQTFKLLWNERRCFRGVFIEQLLVFLILMLCVVSVSRTLYAFIQPGLPDTQDVVGFGYIYRGELDDTSEEQLVQSMDAILGSLKQDPNVIVINESSNISPYMRPDHNYRSDSVTVDDKQIKADVKGSDEKGLELFKLTLTAGEWLPAYVDGPVPVVITQQFTELAGWQSAIGKRIKTRFGELVVVGVIEGLRNGAFAKPHPSIILPLSVLNQRNSYYREFCARVKSGYKNDFSSIYYKEFKRLITNPDIEPLILNMTEMKKTSMLGSIIGLAFKIIPTLFLLIFAFIGTFGLFWLYSRKRTPEFALRIALGSTQSQLTRMVLVESVIITILAAVPGLLLGLFIYKLTPLNIAAMGATLVVMILFSVVSAWYPAYKISKLHPGTALQYE